MMKKAKRRGMAGIVTVVLIMALLMSVSISYLKMMEVEGQVQEMSDSAERAADAAFAGVSYAMAIAQGTKDTFKGATYLEKRPYLVDDVSKTGDFKGGKYDGGMQRNNLSMKVPSAWLYLDENMALVDEDATRPPYRFRAMSYPCYTSPNNIDPNRYMVKAQGNYMYYETGSDNVTATFTAQLVAELYVASASKRLYLKRYRAIPYQKEADFFKNFTQLK
jgi:hypothetical protein